MFERPAELTGVQFYEFWTRALQEGKHYLLVGASSAGNDTDCTVAAKKVSTWWRHAVRLD